MSRLQRLAPIVVLVALAVPASADAATPPRGPEATVRAYVAALRAGQVERACAFLDPSYWGDGAAGCRGSLRAEPLGAQLARVRIEPGALARGARARVVVDLVVKSGRATPWVARARVLLRHVGGRWQIRQTGSLPGIGRRSPARTPSDVAPSGTGPALRRLADDELLAISGNEWMLCELLAPDAPLGNQDGGCGNAGVRGSLDDLRYDVRADRVVIRRISADRARLDVALTIREALRTTAKPGWRVRAHHRTDTQYAVRSSGRWRLAKLSRWAYTLLGVSRPDDVDAPAATATWPFAEVPSLSEHPVPVPCRRPFDVQGGACLPLAAFAAGGGLVAWWWLGEKSALARPVAAGRASGPVADASPTPALAGRHFWMPEGVAPLQGGALVLERDLRDRDSVLRAVPVGPDGRPRGAAQIVGEDDSVQDRPARVVPGPPGATTATILLPSGQVARLGADGRRVGTDGRITEPSEDVRLVMRPDGTLLAAGDDQRGGGTEIRTLTADGRPTGTIAAQAWLATTDVIEERTVALAADGRVLVAWIEVDYGGRGTIRTWAFDPSAPSATAPVAIAIPQARDPDGPSGPGDQALAGAALPDGSWGIAWRWAPKGGGNELWAARLDAAGALATTPRRVTERLGSTALGRTGFGLAGDSVAFIEWPEVTGLPQVRAAPLP